MVIAGFMLTIFFAVAAGAVPGLINYQGRLLAGGQAVTTDSQSPLPITFRFYDASVAGSLLYEELQDVVVVDGVYAVQLGAGTTSNGSYDSLIDAVAEEEGVWLEIEINGEILLPRQKFTSTPYAIRAGEAEVAVTVRDNAIGTFAITNASVTGEKLADGAVTLAKLSTDMCAEGEVLVKTAAGWVCGTMATPLFRPGDFINCYSGPPETQGVAVCTSGVRYSNSSGTGFGECVGEVVPQVETCDGVDNDCNGIVDDNVPGTPLWYRDADGDGFGDSYVTANFCPGQELAGYVQNGDDCNDASYAVNPAFGERCDGTDSNCDDVVDNGCVNTDCTEAEINQVLAADMNVSSACLTAGMALVSCMQNNGCGELSAPDFDCVRSYCGDEWETAIGSVPSECHTGETRSCGTDEGACQAGHETCAADNSWSGICEGEIAPFEEVCDGVDNNCDGAIDNMNTPQWCMDADGDGYAQECIFECEQPGDPGWVAYATILGEGDCDDHAADIYFGAPEICDGRDNDCDGQYDEDAVGTGGSCDTGMSGVCSVGTEVCIGGQIVCEPNTAPQAEVCDGLDNDCDGEMDEDVIPVLNDNQTGVCNSTYKICAGVDGWLEDYSSIAKYEAVEASCDDELDNDCDATVDDGDLDCME